MIRTEPCRPFDADRDSADDLAPAPVRFWRALVRWLTAV